MKRVSLLTVHLCLVYICLLSTATAEIKIEENQTEDTNGIIWQYTFKVTEAKEGQEITIHLALPDSKDLIYLSTPSTLNSDGASSGKWSLQVPKDGSHDITIKVIGAKTRFKDSVIDLDIKVTHDKQTIDEKSERVIGPAILVGRLVTPVYGVGMSSLWDDSIDFKVDKDTLLIENDSERRPFALVGALFSIRQFEWWCFDEVLRFFADDILLSLALTYDTPQNSIDGFVVGLSKHISGDVNFVFGYALGRGEELSPGFEKKADKFIHDRACDPDYEIFQDFKPDGVRKSQQLLDGLPLVATPLEDTKDQMGNRKDPEKFFPGDPVISSFNHAFYIGFVMPFELKAKLTPGKDN